MLPVEYFLYLQIIIFLFITPGTPRIVIISYSMNYGVRNCIWTAFGDVSANIIQATLVIFVIGTFFSDYPFFLNIFKWIGIIYLIYLAYDIYKSNIKSINSKEISQKSFFFHFTKMVFLLLEQVPRLGCSFHLYFHNLLTLMPIM